MWLVLKVVNEVFYTEMHHILIIFLYMDSTQNSPCYFVIFLPYGRCPFAQHNETEGEKHALGTKILNLSQTFHTCYTPIHLHIYHSNAREITFPVRSIIFKWAWPFFFSSSQQDIK